MSPEGIIKKYRLKRHPEGGWFREIIRSKNPVSFKGKKRDAVTSIYFLLLKGEISRWHMIDADEIWIFFDGDGLELHQAELKHNKYSIIELNRNNRQVCVNAGICQAARSKGDYSFLACVVAPGFEFKGFKLPDKKGALLKKLLKLNKKAGRFI